jgi:predicted MPP superfamily phosphohydrolase
MDKMIKNNFMIAMMKKQKCHQIMVQTHSLHLQIKILKNSNNNQFQTSHSHKPKALLLNLLLSLCQMVVQLLFKHPQPQVL